MAGFLVNDKFYAEYARIVRKVDGISGPGVTNDSRAIVINAPPAAPQRRTNNNADKTFFPIIIKANGTSGPNPAYDLYDPADTAYATKLNTAGTLVPKCSRARWQSAVVVTAPADGSVGSAYYDTAGAIQLFDLPETITTNLCEA